MTQLLAALAMTMGVLIGCALPIRDGTTGYVPPTVANVTVPSGLHCEEDETIFWTGIDTLGCVHAGLIHGE